MSEQESGGRLRLQHDSAYSGIYTGSYYDLREGEVVVEAFPLTGVDGDDVSLTLSNPIGGDQVYIQVYNNAGTVTIRGQIVGVGGTAVTYNATDHRWWRIRETGSTIYFEGSPDRSSWTTIHSSTPDFSVSVVDVQLFAGNANVDPATNPNRYSEFDNVNVVPGITDRPKIKIAGSFALKPMKIKVGGSFVEKQMKIKVSGTFINV